MELLTGAALAAVGAAVAGTGAFAVTDRVFPEFSKREQERRRAATAKAPEKKAEKEKSALAKIGDRVARLAPVKGDDAAEYRDELARAGLTMSPSTWHGVRIAVAIGIGALMCILLIAQPELSVPAKIVFCVAAALVAWAMPILMLRVKATKRSEQLEKELPEALELLSMSVKAGYTLNHAIRLVGNTGSGAIAKEFALASSDINLLGMELEQALSRMAKRCGTPSVTSFCSAMAQADKQGTSVVRILAAQAKMARDDQYTKTMEKINKLSTKMTPLIIFTFIPIVMVIAAAPQILTIKNSIG